MNDFEKTILFLKKEIQEANSSIMFFDSDTDGMTSYLQLKKLNKNIIGFPFKKDLEKQIELINSIEKDFDTVIIFDIPFMFDEVLELLKDKKIIWVDHHPNNSKTQIEKYNILHLNPLNFDKDDNRPSSYMAYRICDMKENLFYATLGSVSDFFLLSDIIKELYKYDLYLFNLLLNIPEEKRVELFEFLDNVAFNDIEKRDEISSWIRYLTYECGIIKWKTFFDFLYKLEKNDDIINSVRNIEKLSPIELKAEMVAGKGVPFEDFQAISKKYSKLYKKAVERAKGRYFIYEYGGSMGFTKTLSEELAYNLKDVDIICVSFLKTDKDHYNCSIRSRNTIINTIVSECMKGLDGRGGGHPYACGVNITKTDYPVFIKRFEMKIREILKI